MDAYAMSTALMFAQVRGLSWRTALRNVSQQTTNRKPPTANYSPPRFPTRAQTLLTEIPGIGWYAALTTR